MRKRKLRLEQYKRIPCIHFFTRRVSFNMVNLPDEPTAHIDQHERGPRIHIIKGGKRKEATSQQVRLFPRHERNEYDKRQDPYPIQGKQRVQNNNMCIRLPKHCRGKDDDFEYQLDVSVVLCVREEYKSTSEYHASIFHKASIIEHGQLTRRAGSKRCDSQQGVGQNFHHESTLVRRCS